MRSFTATTLCAALVIPLLTSCQVPNGNSPAPTEIATADAQRKKGPTLTLDEQAKLADPTALQLLEQRSQELAKSKKRVDELETELSQRGRDLEKVKEDSKTKSREKEQIEGLLRDATENERAATEKALSAEIARLKIEQEVLRMRLGNLVKEELTPVRKILWSSRGRLSALAAVLLALTGCRHWDHTPPDVPVARSYAQPSSDGRDIMRVVVPPFQDQTGSPQQAEVVRTALMRALGKRQKFELIPVGEHELREFLPPDVFESGIISRDTLLAAARRYRADGVLFGVLTQFRPYEPLVIGMSVELASVGTGEVVWSSSGLYDAASKDVTQDVHNFNNTQLAGTTSLEGWRIILMSPSRFTEYAASRVASTLP